MTVPGAILVFGPPAAIVAVFARAWWEEHQWQRDEKHAAMRLLRDEAAVVREELDHFDALARQLEQIRLLPEIEPRRFA